MLYTQEYLEAIEKATVAYDGAGHGKRLGNWHPSNSSINSLVSFS